MRKAIAANAKLTAMKVSVFAQGSHRARTNVRQGSDVDICVRYDDVFFTDYPPGITNATFGFVTSTFSYAEFKNLVGAALVAYFGENGVHRGNKAFDVHANTYRIDADVVPALEHRKYGSDGTHIKGIEFNPDAGGRVINWPDQNYANGVARNTEAQRMFKRTIRILKRMRNHMEEENVAGAKGIPSFLIECLVWNVPVASILKETYTAAVRQVMIDVYSATATDEQCAHWHEVNLVKPLFKNTQPWNRTQVRTFISAAWQYAGFQQ